MASFNISPTRSIGRLEVENAVLMEAVAADVAAGKAVCFRPRGSSMLPFIDPERGDVVVVEKTPVKLTPGMIVLVRIDAPGGYLMHRIERVGKGRLMLRGDGNVSGTEVCDSAGVIGVITRCERDGRQRVIYGKRVVIWRRLLFMRRYLLALLRITGIIS